MVSFHVIACTWTSYTLVVIICLFSSHGDDGWDCDGGCTNALSKCHWLANIGWNGRFDQPNGTGRRPGSFWPCCSFHFKLQVTNRFFITALEYYNDITSFCYYKNAFFLCCFVCFCRCRTEFIVQLYSYSTSWYYPNASKFPIFIDFCLFQVLTLLVGRPKRHLAYRNTTLTYIYDFVMKTAPPR